MKSLLFIVMILSCHNIYSQVAAGSLFRSMRSENPAVISERPAATLGLQFKMDKVEKTQDTTGGITSSESEVDITNTSFFYGGKGGGAFTTEISGEKGSGEKNDAVTTSGVRAEQKIESDLTMLNLSVGFLKHFGASAIILSNENKVSGSMSSTTKTDLMIYTLGFKVDLGLDVGLFYQYAPLESGGGSDIDMSRVGFGVGVSGKKYHFEVAYVKNLSEEKEMLGGGTATSSNYAIHNPAKIMGTIEFKFGKISLGITSNYYMEGFFDFNNLMYYTMVMSQNKENRLENTFNFSLGGDKGHSFSGGITIASVESTEAPPTLLSGSKFKTTTDIKGIQLSYSYNF